MHKCSICKKRFVLSADKHYIAREDFSVIENFTKTPLSYDAFDCPYCGSQYLAQERKTKTIVDNDEE